MVSIINRISLLLSFNQLRISIKVLFDWTAAFCFLACDSVHVLAHKMYQVVHIRWSIFHLLRGRQRRGRKSDMRKGGSFSHVPITAVERRPGLFGGG